MPRTRSRLVAECLRGTLWSFLCRLGSDALRLIIYGTLIVGARAEPSSGYEITSWKKDSGLEHDEVLGITQSLDGYLWVATPKGLARFDGARFKHYANSDLTLAHEEIIGGLQCDATGNLWLLTTRGGIVRGRPGSFIRLMGSDTAGAAEAHGIYTDGQRQIVVSTRLGEVLRSEGGQLVPWLPARSQAAGRFVGINLAMDRTAVVRHGFVLYWWDAGTWQEVKAPDGGEFYALKTGSCQEGGMWIASRDGLRRFSQGRWGDKEIRFSQRVPSIQTVLEDSGRNVWISTGAKGLLRFDPEGKAMTISVGQGLSHESVRHLFEDAEGNLWAGTEGGGLNRLRSSARAPLSPGLSQIRSRGPWLAPRLLIQEIRADDKLVWEQPSPRLNTELVSSSAVADLRLPLGVQSMEVSFAALSFASSNPSRCQCRIEGLDRDWIDLSNRQQVGFTNLPPRKYRFRLRAAQADGHWALEETSFSFFVLPHYWQTWWFRSWVLAGLTGSLGWFYFWRISNLQRQHALHQSFAQRLIQSQESERQRIAADLHDSLGQKLLVIKNCAQFGLTDVARTSEVKEQLERVSSFASESLEEIRQIAHNLRPYQLDQIGLTRAVRSLGVQIEQTSPVKVRLDLDDLEGLFPPAQEINVYRILQEGLNNVVRHAHATEVRLIAENRGAELHLTLADNGKGLGEPTPSRTGFGLSNIRERVLILGGQFQIDSSPQTGTRLFARLPINAQPHEK